MTFRIGQDEIWKPVTGYEGLYEVSDMGRVRGIDRKDSRGHRIKSRVLRPGKDNSGHVYVNLHNGVTCRRYIHRLVLEVFRGPCRDGMEACHGPDRDPSNNHLSNLRWDARTANQADRIEHGTSNRGARHGMAKINETDIERIFDLRRNGCTQYEIADWMLISQPQVSWILAGKAWAHLGASR